MGRKMCNGRGWTCRIECQCMPCWLYICVWMYVHVCVAVCACLCVSVCDCMRLRCFVSTFFIIYMFVCLLTFFYVQRETWLKAAACCEADSSLAFAFYLYPHYSLSTSTYPPSTPRLPFPSFPLTLSQHNPHDACVLAVFFETGSMLSSLFSSLHTHRVTTGQHTYMYTHIHIYTLTHTQRECGPFCRAIFYVRYLNFLGAP